MVSASLSTNFPFFSKVGSLPKRIPTPFAQRGHTLRERPKRERQTRRTHRADGVHDGRVALRGRQLRGGREPRRGYVAPPAVQEITGVEVRARVHRSGIGSLSRAARIPGRSGRFLSCGRVCLVASHARVADPAPRRCISTQV